MGEKSYVFRLGNVYGRCQLPMAQLLLADCARFMLGTYDGRTGEYRRKMAIEDIWNRISKLLQTGKPVYPVVPKEEVIVERKYHYVEICICHAD